jgi:hypothetical protein
MSTYTTNKKHDVGDPCLTPIDAVMMEDPRILTVTVYIDTRAANITAPHPNDFSTTNILDLGTRSYAFEKSTKQTNNFNFFLMHKSKINLSDTICSKHPRFG